MPVLTPSALAAALLTMGVSSFPSVRNKRLNSSWAEVDALGYGAAKRAQADVREVNQSPAESLLMSGRKCCSIELAESSTAIFEMDSAAYHPVSDVDRRS